MKPFIFFFNKKARLKVLFTIAVLLLCSLSFLLINRISNMNKAGDWVNHTNLVRLALSETLSMLKDAEADQRGFLLSHDSSFLDDCNIQKECLDKQLDSLRSLVKDNPVERNQVDTLQALVNKRFDRLQQVMADHADSTHISYFHLKEDLLAGKLAMDSVKYRLMVLENLEEELLKQRTSTSNYYGLTTPLFAILLTSAALLIIVFAFHKLGTLLKLSDDHGQQAGKAAKKAGSLLENAEHIAKLASWEYNFSSQHVEHSSNIHQLFGYEPGNFGSGSGNFLHLIDEGDRNRLVQNIENCRSQGPDSCTMHFWAKCKNGERRYFQFTIRFSTNEKGEEIITGTTQDITEEYLLRQEAQQRAYLTEQVVEHNVDMIMAVDNQLRITLWNKALEEAFSLPRNEVMGKSVTDVFPYLENDTKLQLTKDALQGKETINKQIRFLKDQKYGQASYIPLRNTEGHIEGALIITHDITELKQTTKLLQESNLRYEQAEQVGKLGSYHRNIQTGEAEMSDNMYRLFEIEKGSVTPTMGLFINMLHPDDKQRTLEAVQKHEASGIINPVRCRIIRKDGSIMHVKISAFPVYNEKGEMVIYGSVMDVTDEELLKQQLVQRTNLMESIIENSTEIIAAIDTNMRYVLVNEAHQRVLGLGKKDMLGKKVLEVFPQLEKHNNYKLIQKALQGKPSYQVEYTDVKTGIITEINHIPLKDHEGKVTGLLVVAHDITERKKAAVNLEKANTEMQLRNKALQEAYAFNRHITDLAPNGIYVYDKNEATAVFTNKKMVELHGYSTDDLNKMGSDMLNLIVHPDDLPLLYNELNRFETATDKDVIELEYRMRNKAGQYRNVICRESVFNRNDNGEPVQFIGVAIDVTDLKNAEKELKEKNRQLLQSNEELTSFNYVASHDLQEPLRKIQTFANFLEETEKGLSEQGKISVKRMQSAAARMRELIKDLLSFSRIEMEKEELEAVDLNLIFKMAKSSLRSSIDEKKATIIPATMPTVQGVAFKLQQLFENILGNAIKYSVPGLAPVVSITCSEVVAAKNNGMGLLDGAPYHRICIQDNGIGFDQQYADKIFELFQRLHTQNEYPGTGLGLAICKKIVLVHGGHIQASSIPGEGSLFEIFLPVAEVTEAAAV